MADRFPSPFDMPTPPGAEGWKDLYAYSTVFSEDRREYEESAFWFMDGVHTPEVMPPWDATIMEYAIIALSQYNTRHYVIPPALGVDLRFLHGYMYLSPVGVTDPKEIEARVPQFAERAGYYFANWDRLYAAWMPKVRALIDELEAISFSPLPDREDMAVITEGRGTGSALDLFTTYHRLVDLLLKLWHYHFEFLNLGYVAYLDFFGCCQQLFPSIPDQAIAKMVAGIQVDLFQPDEELKKLAQLAVDLGLADRFAGSAPARSAAEVLDGLRGDPQGDKWLAAWEEAKQPWFNFSAGSGFYHSDKVWLENLDIPLGFLRTYIAKVQRGETLERPMEAVIAERDRIVAEYTDLIDSDEDRATFGAKLGLARTVFPYVENHNFYVKHWAHSVVWRKMRDLGRLFVEAGFYQIPVYDEHGKHRVDYVEGQDMMAWVTQGPITDRTVEHLGRSDVGVTMLRRMFKENMALAARGEDPLGVYRDFRDRIDLPCEKNKFDAGVSFAIDFIDRASSRFSPQADALKKLHIKANENRKAAAG